MEEPRAEKRKVNKEKREKKVENKGREERGGVKSSEWIAETASRGKL